MTLYHSPITRYALAASAALSLLLLPAPAFPATITTTWNNAAVGDWFTPANWSNAIPNNTPTNIYKAVINNGTVTLATQRYP